MTDSVTSWTKPFAGITGLPTLSLINAGGSWIMFSSDRDGSQVSSDISNVHSQIKVSVFPKHGQFIGRSWLEITPDYRSWTHPHSVPDKTETMMWNQSSKEHIITKTYHVVETVNTGANLGNYQMHSWVPLLVNKIELWTQTSLNEVGNPYTTVIHTLEPWFQPVLDILGSQETVEKTDIHWIFPESKSNLISYIFNMPLSLALSKGDSTRHWTQYEDSKMRPSSQMDCIDTLSGHVATIFKYQMKTKDTVWSLSHSIANVIESFIQSKGAMSRPWTQPESDIVQTWTYSETQFGKPLTQLKADKLKPWIETKPEKVRPSIQHRFQIGSPRTQDEKSKNKHWLKPKAGTIRSWSQNEIETVILWSQPEFSTARYLFWSKSDHTGLRTKTDFKTPRHFIHPEVYIVRTGIQSEGRSIQAWKKSEAFTFRPWMQSKVNTVTPWTTPEVNNVRAWFQTPTNIIRTWNQLESQTNHSWSETTAGRILNWYCTQMDMFKNRKKNEFQKVYSWTQRTIPRIWTQTQDGTVRLWLHTHMVTVSQTSNNWIQSEIEIVSPWTQFMADKLKGWIQHSSYTTNTLKKLDVDVSESRVQNEDSTVKQWTQPEPPEINSWTHSETNTVISWTQAETPIISNWTITT